MSSTAARPSPGDVTDPSGAEEGIGRIPCVVGVDVGGTKIAAGLVDATGRVHVRARRRTPPGDPVAVRDAVVEIVETVRRGGDAVAVGIGAAGLVCARRGRVLFSPHVAWRDEPLRESLEEALDLPVFVDNDANAAAWAEWRFGAGRGESRLVCVTVGTGIGGGVVLDGALERGRWGLSGEFGHMVVEPGGRSCECGNRGCWEQYVSGNVLGRRARQLASEGVPGAAVLLDRVAGRGRELDGPTVTRAAREGDPLARRVLEEAGRWLGLGLANLAAVLDPGTFVIGGGACAAEELLLGPARESLATVLPGRGWRPQARVVRAAFGAEAGVVGAADLARRFLRSGTAGSGTAGSGTAGSGGHPASASPGRADPDPDTAVPSVRPRSGDPLP